jgi:hypothetical protein
MSPAGRAPTALIACIIGLVLAGGVISGVALGAGAKKQPVEATKAAAAKKATATTTGPFTSNEDAAHEATESAAVEAAEDSGRRPHGSGARGPNEGPAHEAGESAAREAQEGTGTTTTTTP